MGKRKVMNNSVWLKPDSTISNLDTTEQCEMDGAGCSQIVDNWCKSEIHVHVCLNNPAFENNFNLCSSILKSFLYKVKKTN